MSVLTVLTGQGHGVLFLLLGQSHHQGSAPPDGALFKLRLEGIHIVGKKRLTPDKEIKGLDGLTVGDFWSWAYSDIMGNLNRSVFAEFVVASALGIHDKCRVEWDAYDLEYRGRKIEVKCAAHIQSWQQSTPSLIRFDIAKKKIMVCGD